MVAVAAVIVVCGVCLIKALLSMIALWHPMQQTTNTISSYLDEAVGACPVH